MINVVLLLVFQCPNAQFWCMNTACLKYRWITVSKPPVAAMERSKVTYSIQVCWRKLGPNRKVSFDLFPKITRLLAGWTPVFLPHPWCRSPSYIVFSSERSIRCYCDRREISFLPLLSSLFSWRASRLLIEGTNLSSYFLPCYFSPPSFGRILRALELIFALPTHWKPLTVSLTSHLLDDFHTVVWLCLATCWRRTSERIWVLARCILSSLVSLGFTKSWVG